MIATEFQYPVAIIGELGPAIALPRGQKKAGITNSAENAESLSAGFVMPYFVFMNKVFIAEKGNPLLPRYNKDAIINLSLCSG